MRDQAWDKNVPEPLYQDQLEKLGEPLIAPGICFIIRAYMRLLLSRSSVDSDLGQQWLMAIEKENVVPLSFLLTQTKKTELRETLREQIPSTTSKLLVLVFYFCVMNYKFSSLK